MTKAAKAPRPYHKPNVIPASQTLHADTIRLAGVKAQQIILIKHELNKK